MSTIWTPAKRAICALNGGTPDEVPTFELEFQLAPELCGKDFVYPQQLRGLSGAELEYTLEQNAYYMAEVMDRVTQRFTPEECAKFAEMLTIIDEELMPEIFSPHVHLPE